MENSFGPGTSGSTVSAELTFIGEFLRKRVGDNERWDEKHLSRDVFCTIVETQVQVWLGIKRLQTICFSGLLAAH